MGVNYIVFPIAGFDDEARSWLITEIGLKLPEWDGESRYPTPAELRLAVEGLTDCEIEFSKNGNDLNVDLQVRDCPMSWATIWMKDYYPRCAEGLPHRLTFHRGEPALVVRIMERLARTCGPFAVAANGESWIIVTENTQPDTCWL